MAGDKKRSIRDICNTWKLFSLPRNGKKADYKSWLLQCATDFMAVIEEYEKIRDGAKIPSCPIEDALEVGNYFTIEDRSEVVFAVQWTKEIKIWFSVPKDQTPEALGKLDNIIGFIEGALKLKKAGFRYYV